MASRSCYLYMHPTNTSLCYLYLFISIKVQPCTFKGLKCIEVVAYFKPTKASVIDRYYVECIYVMRL